MGWVGEMLWKAWQVLSIPWLRAVAAAKGMSKDINDVMQSLADEMTRNCLRI
jgi:hypothetical protein